MRINLGNTPLFRGMTVPDIEEMLCCLRAAERTYKKGAVILPEGTPTEQLGGQACPPPLKDIEVIRPRPAQAGRSSRRCGDTPR